MSHLKNRPRAFTLIEIIVVLIILGVLAAIALPNLFIWIKKSQAAEAFVQLKEIKDQLALCVQQKANTPNIGECYLVPNTFSTNFSYQVSGTYNPNPPYDYSGIWVEATSLSNANDRIKFWLGPPDQFICTPHGVFQGMC